MTKKRTASLKLPARLDSSASAGLRETLLSRKGKSLTLAGEGVVFIGALSAQVLLAAANTWRKDGVELLVKSPSDALLEGLKVLGLSPESINART